MEYWIECFFLADCAELLGTVGLVGSGEKTEYMDRWKEHMDSGEWAECKDILSKRLDGDAEMPGK